MTNNINEPLILRRQRYSSENLTIDQLIARREQLNQMLTDRLGHPVEVHESLTEINDQNIDEVLENIIRETVVERVPTVIRSDQIINHRDFVDWIISLFAKLQDVPGMNKLILVSGLIVLVIGGGYIAYKLTTRSNSPTIVTPFGARLTTFVQSIKYKD